MPLDDISKCKWHSSISLLFSYHSSLLGLQPTWLIPTVMHQNRLINFDLFSGDSEKSFHLLSFICSHMIKKIGLPFLFSLFICKRLDNNEEQNCPLSQHLMFWLRTVLVWNVNLNKYINFKTSKSLARKIFSQNELSIEFDG